MFTRDGKVIETPGTLLVGPLPVLRVSPGLGAWQHEGGPHYTGAFTFFRINVPANTFAGTQRMTEAISLNKDADEFTSTGTSEVFDTNDLEGRTAADPHRHTHRSAGAARPQVAPLNARRAPERIRRPSSSWMPPHGLPQGRRAGACRVISRHREHGSDAPLHIDAHGAERGVRRADLELAPGRAGRRGSYRRRRMT